MNINQLVQNNSFAVEELLRQHNVIASDLQTGIKKAYQQDGEKFMIKLVNRLTGKSALSGFDDATEMGPPPPPGSYTDASGVTQIDGASDGKFWEVWGNLLNYAGATGATINQFKQNLAGSATVETTTATAAASNKILYIAAGVIVVVIVLVLIFKK